MIRAGYTCSARWTTNVSHEYATHSPGQSCLAQTHLRVLQLIDHKLLANPTKLDTMTVLGNLTRVPARESSIALRPAPSAAPFHLKLLKAFKRIVRFSSACLQNQGLSATTTAVMNAFASLTNLLPLPKENVQVCQRTVHGEPSPTKLNQGTRPFLLFAFPVCLAFRRYMTAFYRA